MTIIKSISRLIKNEVFFYSFLSFFIIIIGQLPVILHILHTPKGFYYPFLDTVAFASDYYYLGLIRYGMGNDWLLKIPYVTVDHTGSLIQIFFLALGKLSKLIYLQPAEIFALSRIAGGLIYLISVIFFLRAILGAKRAKYAFLLFLFIQPIPVFDPKKLFTQDYNMWIWFFGEAGRRISILPSHYSFGKGLIMIALSLLWLFIQKGRKPLLVLMGIIIILAGIIYTPPVFIVLVSLSLSFFVYQIFLFFKREKLPRGMFTACLFFTLLSLLPLIALKLELSKGYPWNMWQRVELGWNDRSFPFENHYLHMTGWLLLLIPFGLPSIFLKKINFWNIFLIVWSVSAFILFPFANLLSVGKFRFTEGVQIVPLSILAFIGLEQMLQVIKTKLGRIGINMVKVLLLIILIANFTYYSYQAVYDSTVKLWPFWTNVYFRPNELSGLQYLEKNASRGEIIISDVYSGNYLPTFARVRTVIGLSDFYPSLKDYDKEEKKVYQILQGLLGEKETKQYLEEKKVDLLYHRKDTFGEKTLYPSLLNVIFDNDLLRIYRVKRN